jgi:hypothetical protein
MPSMPSKSQRPPTYEDANLLLRLYELRREEKLRVARDWFMQKFHVGSLEELQKLCPAGSNENAYFRMVTSYWEMAATFVTSGVLHEDLFIKNSSELLFVWIRVSDIVAALRDTFKNPDTFGNIETLAIAMTEDRKRRGSYEAFVSMVRGTRS